MVKNNENDLLDSTSASLPVILPLGFLRSRGGGPDLSGFGCKTFILHGDSPVGITMWPSRVGNDG